MGRLGEQTCKALGVEFDWHEEKKVWGLMGISCGKPKLSKKHGLLSSCSMSKITHSIEYFV
jgi:hypothetical protein